MLILRFTQLKTASVSDCAESRGRFSSVHANDLANEEFRLIGRKEHDGLGYFFRSSCSLCGNARDQARFAFGGTREAVKHSSLDRTRRDCVYPHASRSTFKRA